jgi:hypothetical protein
MSTSSRAPGDAIQLLDAELVALACGAAWWPAEATLIVADLHFEKGSSFARRGALVPPFDTAATLARLAATIEARAPARVISLGDAFHDGFGPERLNEADRAALARLQAGREWIWIVGNHDARAVGDVGGAWVEELSIGALTFRHEPRRGAVGEVAGHLHPAARVKVAAGTVRRHCFAGDGTRLILPAYGAYAGGLDVTGRAFAGLFEPARLVVHLVGEGCVHRFPATSIAGVGFNRDGAARRRASR